MIGATIVYIHPRTKQPSFINQTSINMSKINIGRTYVSKTILRILRKYIAEDQRKIDKRTQLANKITDAIEIRGITHKELASRIGRRPSEIKRLLKAKQDFSADILSRIETELAIRLTEV
jgi:ribosome-binding protein aMBF1 (putative translation factor)